MIYGALNRNNALIKLDKETGSTIFNETFNNEGTDAFEHVALSPNGIVAVGYVCTQDSNNTIFYFIEFFIFRFIYENYMFIDTLVDC